eukprot:6205733-Pleurochrysis_carterae.AAC.4
MQSKLPFLRFYLIRQRIEVACCGVQVRLVHPQLGSRSRYITFKLLGHNTPEPRQEALLKCAARDDAFQCNLSICASVGQAVAPGLFTKVVHASCRPALLVFRKRRDLGAYCAGAHSRFALACVVFVTAAQLSAAR